MGLLVTLGFANVLTALALVLLALSFATDHWVDITVRRDELTKLYGKEVPLFKDQEFFSRNRGLFRTCYEGNETQCMYSK